MLSTLLTKPRSQINAVHLCVQIKFDHQPSSCNNPQTLPEVICELVPYYKEETQLLQTGDLKKCDLLCTELYKNIEC